MTIVRRCVMPRCHPAMGAVLALLTLPGMAHADVDPALLQARRAKSHPALNMLTYRHFDELFNSRQVDSGSSRWELGPSSLKLPDSVAFTAPDGVKVDLQTYLETSRVNAFLVLKDGKVVREIYRDGSHSSSRFIGFSMSKSIISMLVGIALKEGSISSIDDPLTRYLPELNGSAYAGVTLRQLLRMRSGTSWREDYAPGTALDKVRELSVNSEKEYYESYAKSLTRIASPGSVFNYSSLDTELMGCVLARVTGRNVADYMSEKLWKPAGMEAPGYWALQGPGGRQHEWYSAGFSARLRDFGRIGQLMLDRGEARGQQIVPASWVESSTRPEGGDRHYFYFWWGLPQMDGFAANGVQGQHILIDRPSRTVVVVLSFQDPAARYEGSAERMFRSIVAYLSAGGTS